MWRLSTLFVLYNVFRLIGQVTFKLPVYVYALPQFIQLMDEDIVSLTGLMLLVNPSCREDSLNVVISQLSLSLYLMTKCQLKLHHSLSSLAQTLDHIELARRECSYPVFTLEQLLL